MRTDFWHSIPLSPSSTQQGKPAVIIMNSAHLVGHEDEGKRLLTVLQQRAEKWASAGTATFIFTSNDYFIYDLLRRNSNRMDTLTFKDLSQKQSLEVVSSQRVRDWRIHSLTDLSHPPDPTPAAILSRTILVRRPSLSQRSGPRCRLPDQRRSSCASQ